VSSRTRRARVLRLAERTLSCPTAPYREGAVMAWIREFASERPQLALRSDRDGNLELRRHGVRPSRSPLVLAAHMDHPGFRALRCRRAGRDFALEAVFLGGVHPRFFPGAGVRFFSDGREVRARVRRVRRVRDALQVALAGREEVAAGAFGTWDLPAFRRSRRAPDLIETRAADDLAGVAAILALLDGVEAIDPRRAVDVRGLFTRAEEVGFVGALAVARNGRLPRGARLVAVEASKALPEAPQVAGPILRVGDRTSVFDDALTRWIAGVGAALAASGRFRFQRRLMDGGTCESTAYQLYGYRCAAMCLPLGNYHNMSEGGRIAPESIRLSDLVGLVRFFEGLVRGDAGAPPRRHSDPLRRRLEEHYRRGRAELRRDPFA
jgi:putative aminopeptidase FrvX